MGTSIYLEMLNCKIIQEFLSYIIYKRNRGESHDNICFIILDSYIVLVYYLMFW